MSNGNECPSIEEIKQAVAEVVDEYYNELVEYLGGRFREKDLHIDQVQAVVDSVAFNLGEHRKIEDVVGRIAQDVAGIKAEMDCIEDAIRDLDAHLERHFDYLAKKIAEYYWREAPEDYVMAFKKIRNFIEQMFEVDPNGITEFFSQLGAAIGGALSGLGDWFGGLIDWIKKIAEALSKIPDFVSEFIGTVAKFFRTVWDALTGFVKWLWDNVQELARDPWGWFKSHIVEPLWQGLQWLGARLWEGLQWVWERLVEFGRWVWEGLVGVGRAIYEAVRSALERICDIIRGAAEWLYNAFVRPSIDSVVNAFIEATKRAVRRALEESGDTGEIFIFTNISLNVFYQMLQFVAPFYFISDTSELIKEVEAELSGAPFGVGLKGKVRAMLGRLLKWLGEMGKDAGRAVFQGFTIGLALSTLDPFRYVVRPVARAFFGPIFSAALGTDMFFELPSEGGILEFLRRALPWKILRELGAAERGGVLRKQTPEGKAVLEFKPFITWEDAREYVARILNVYGLPGKFMEVYKLEQHDFYLRFIDRFGAERTLPLAPVYELPTHSEMLRMTQRDVFPGVDVMKGVAALRGWAPDITVLSYLMTFRYPSFEKLWQFWMRAISGLLWFHLSPDNPIRQIFSREAGQIGAGVPVTPYEVQEALARGGAKAVSVFESAIGAYFKWLEYSNFSWFSPRTEMYGVKLGEAIYRALGGWVADSWLMADIAADIPGKIDMRWMSRYGIFLYMAERFEKRGVSFEGFAPLVRALPALLDEKPASAIQVDLRWFSKLLQATGLHPAWVPVTTVAENIMVISDEMTLLRTGWINMFKEGMLSVDKLERSLGGIITVSYRVGFFDTVEKTWKSGWMNLPVRWLPHERRLLALRALMDRALDIYREYYRFLIRMVARNIVSWEEAKQRLDNVVRAIVDGFFRRDLARILGVSERDVPPEMLPAVEPGYLAAWEPYVKEMYEEEKYERARIYLRYLVSRLADRFAQGFITADELERAFDIFRRYAKATEHEVEMIRLASGLLGTYYERRLAAEAYINKYRRLRITREELLRRLKELGIEERIAELLIEKYARTYVPTLSQIATISEIVPEVLTLELGGKKFYEKMIEFYDLTDVEKKVWKLYIERKPYKSDVDKLVTNIRALMSYGAGEDLIRRLLDVPEKVGLREWLAQWGIDEKEYRILLWQARTDEYERAWREAHLSVSRLASWAEHVPEAVEWLAEYLRRHGLPEDVVRKWREYTFVRSIAGEANLVRSRAIELMSAGAPETVVLGALGLKGADELRRWGISRDEWDVIKRVARLEAYKDVWRWFYVSPDVLRDHIELMPENAEKLAAELESYGLPKEWIGYWRTYLERRALRDDIAYLKTAIRHLLEKDIDLGTIDFAKLYEQGMELYRKVGGFLSRFGITEKEFGLWYAAAIAETKIPKELTVSFLAVLSEYVFIPEEMIERVLRWYRIPADWWGYIKLYLRAKPLRDELRLLASRVYEAWVRRVSLGMYEQKAVGLLRAYGWTEEELDIVKLAADIERIVRESEARWPTPETIAALAEYVPKFRQYLDQSFEAHRVPPELRPLYRRYSYIRPWMDELRRLTAEVIRDYAQHIIDDKAWKGFLEELRKFDFEDEEITFINTLAALMRKRYEAAGRAAVRVPTPETAAAIAEYVPEIRGLLDKVFEAHNVPPEFRPIYRKYSYVRPWMDEARRLVTELMNDYAQGVITREELEAELKGLSELGFEKEEIEIVLKIAELRRQRYEKRRRRRAPAAPAAPATAPTFVW